ncbi:MAG: lipoate--protein ligase family protein, partial [Rhodanobacteraceae bacterium]
ARPIRARPSSRSWPMLFDRLVVYDDRSRADAATNMAIDEALLELSREPVLRLYGWKRPALSFGYFGKFAEVAEQVANRDVVRRWTGGGSVPHGDDLTYSLVTPATHPAFAQGPRAIYAELHRAIRDALAAEGFVAKLAAAATPKISDACFANPVRDDVLLGSRKIAGAAQRRTRRGFLQQGSIQVSNLSQNFRERFRHALSAEVAAREISREILQRATVLVAEKYGTAEWLRRC